MYTLYIVTNLPTYIKLEHGCQNVSKFTIYFDYNLHLIIIQSILPISQSCDTNCLYFFTFRWKQMTKTVRAPKRGERNSFSDDADLLEVDL